MATITGTAGNDNLNGTGGDDVLDGAGGIDTINAGDGDDTVRLVGGLPYRNPDYNIVDGGGGHDVLDLTGWGKPLTISAGLGGAIQAIEDYGWLTPDDYAFTAVAQTYNVEELWTGPAGASISINSGLVGVPDGLPEWKVVAGSGNDAISDGRGNDTIDAGGGADYVSFTGGNDRIALGDGDDRYNVLHPSGYAEHVIVDGGAGQDTITFSDVAAVEGVSFDLAAHSANAGLATFTLTGFETIQVLNNLDDFYRQHSTSLPVPAWHGTFAGDDNANRIVVSSIGDGVFLGRGGDDTIVATMSGNVTAYGGQGNDNILCGDGNDWIMGDGHYAGDTVPASTGDGGSDTLSGGNGNDHIFGNSLNAIQGSVDGADSISAGSGMDYVNGNAGNDTIEGNSGADRLYGGAGDDVIWGDDSISGWSSEIGGDDHINGNKGNDTLHGGGGNDEILGGQGDDLIDGGAGIDTLSGNAGNDTFYLNGSAHFSINGAQANLTDVITDYQDGQDRFEDFYPVVAVLHPGAAADFASALALASLVLPATNTLVSLNQDVAAVQVGADTYLFFDNLGHGPESAVRLLNVNAAAIDTSDFVHT